MYLDSVQQRNVEKAVKQYYRVKSLHLSGNELNNFLSWAFIIFILLIIALIIVDERWLSQLLLGATAIVTLGIVGNIGVKRTWKKTNSKELRIRLAEIKNTQVTHDEKVLFLNLIDTIISEDYTAAQELADHSVQQHNLSQLQFVQDAANEVCELESSIPSQ